MAGRKVLIIEPDDEIARMVEGFLRASKFDVARARDVDQGRWLASVVRPQVVLVDSLPEDGIETAEQFREDGSVANFPLVMMVPENLDDEQPDLAQSLRDSYDGFLYKPFADTELLRVVENFTGFGDSEEAEGALNSLLDEQNANPELRNVVEELQQRQSNGEEVVEDSKGVARYAPTEKLAGKPKGKAGAKTKQLNDKIKKLEKELASVNKESRKQAKRIADLLDSISDMELDQEFSAESSEAEKTRLQNEIEALEKHNEKLEKSQSKALELLEPAIKALKKNS